jgi:hypothetical protein
MVRSLSTVIGNVESYLANRQTTIITCLQLTIYGESRILRGAKTSLATSNFEVYVATREIY